MRVNCGLLISVFALIMFQFADTYGQNKELKYGKTPDKLFPYQNFQKAYKYHFVEPVQFYGAGREKAEPTDIEEVRIGFLGPLEGSPLVPLGRTNAQWCQTCLGGGKCKGWLQ